MTQKDMLAKLLEEVAQLRRDVGELKARPATFTYPYSPYPYTTPPNPFAPVFPYQPTVSKGYTVQ